jgi:hypothetical protein
MVPDIFADKNRKAIDEKNRVNKRTGELIPIIDEYVPPKDYQFRDEFEVQVGMKDFLLRTKPPGMDNPNGLSVFASRPKYITEKEKKVAEQQEALEKFIAAGKPHDWYMYHKLPPKLEPIGQKFGDKWNKIGGHIKDDGLYLKKDAWIPAYLELARTMKDDFVYGKPKLDLYYRGMKTEAKNQEFGNIPKAFNVIH